MPRWDYPKELAAWKVALMEAGVSETTLRNYPKQAGYAANFAKKHGWPAHPRNITPEHVYQYYDSIQGLKSKSQAAYMTAFFQFLKFAKNKNVLNMKMRLYPMRGEVFWLTREQIMHLFATAPYPQVLAAEVIWTYTGIREIELRKLRLRSLTNDWLYVESGKRRKARKIPIDEEFWDMLEPYLSWRTKYLAKWGPSDYFMVHPKVPVSNTGPPVPYVETTLSQATTNHGMREGIPHTSAHAFRRHFGRELWENNCPLEQIQIYYGHKSPQQTLEYIGITETMSAEAMRKYRSSYRPDPEGG